MSERPPLHLHIISMHTSPLAQPGRGDAGGMNVYIDRSLRAILATYRNISCEIFTLSTAQVPHVTRQISRRAPIHQIYLPQAAGATKEELAHFVPDFAAAIAGQAYRAPNLVHSHYWLSGLAALTSIEATGRDIPLVHTMHTTAAVKDARAGSEEHREPAARYSGEQTVVDSASALTVNTADEGEQMVRFYAADPKRIRVIPPGVDTGIFTPHRRRGPANRGSDRRARIVFAGRLQPLKGPHILVEALALLADELDVELEIIGRSNSSYENQLLHRAQELGLAHRVHLRDPLPPRQLADRFRRADIVACPSSSETFGLVALEAQACATPVLASKADGLVSAVDDGVSGLLVQPRTPQAWAQAIDYLVRRPQLRQRLGAQARARTLTMRWSDTAQRLVDLYHELATGS